MPSRRSTGSSELGTIGKTEDGGIRAVAIIVACGHDARLAAGLKLSSPWAKLVQPPSIDGPLAAFHPNGQCTVGIGFSAVPDPTGRPICNWSVCALTASLTWGVILIRYVVDIQAVARDNIFPRCLNEQKQKTRGVRQRGGGKQRLNQFSCHWRFLSN